MWGICGAQHLAARASVRWQHSRIYRRSWKKWRCEVAAIPLGHPTLDRVRSLVPPQHLLKCFVAGSAACRYPQNADVDVWVTRLRQPMWGEMLRHFEALGHTPSAEALEEYANVQALLVYSHDGLQILLATEDIVRVVANFDVTCHMAAMNVVTGKVWKHPRYTEEVRIHWMYDTRKTLQRVAKFAARYGDASAHTDPQIVQACQMLGSEGIRSWRERKLFRSGLTLAHMVEEGL